MFPIKGHPLGPGGNGREDLFDHCRSATTIMPRTNKSNTVSDTGMTGSVGPGKQGVEVDVFILAAGSYKGRGLASSTSSTSVGHLAQRAQHRQVDNDQSEKRILPTAICGGKSPRTSDMSRREGQEMGSGSRYDGTLDGGRPDNHQK